MKIVIENQTKEVASVPKRNDDSKRWHIATQKALLFKNGESYPDKFELTLRITENESEANAINPFPVGEYTFSEDAYVIDRRNNISLDPLKLKLITQDKQKAA